MSVLNMSQSFNKVSISGKLVPDSHLETDWRLTSRRSASCSWVMPSRARRYCRFSLKDIVLSSLLRWPYPTRASM